MSSNGINDGITSLNASDSDIPSIANSLQNLTSSKQTLSQQPPQSPDPEQFIAELLEKAKFYTSLCLGTTAILSVFAFLFLIPFVVDPAISVIVADYEQSAITCMVTDHVFGEGLRNCTWSSCREGCTTAATKCHQMLVNYSKIPWDVWQTENRNLNQISWDVADTKLLINSEGCGYPPRVNCTEFAKRYGFSRVGEPFPCFYSKAYPEMVITRYSWDDNLQHLILSIIIPSVLFATSISVLSYWYSPCCDRTCNKSTIVYADDYETKEENLLCRSDDEDDDLDF